MDHGIGEHAQRQLAVQDHGDQQGVDHGDGRRLDRGEDAGADADEDQRDQAQAGQGRHQSHRHRAPARKGLGAVAAIARHHVTGGHQGHGHQQGRHDPGREQAGDRQAAPGRGREQDQVVRRRHQQRHQGGGDADVYGEITVVSALDHLRDHRATHRRHVGDGRAGHAAEKQRRQDRHLAQATAHASHQGRSQCDQAFGDAAAHHDLAGEDEQRDRDQRGRTGTGLDLLDQHHRGQVQVQQGGQGSGGQGEGDRYPEGQQQSEHDEQQGDGHLRGLLPAVPVARRRLRRWVRTPAPGG